MRCPACSLDGDEKCEKTEVLIFVQKNGFSINRPILACSRYHENSFFCTVFFAHGTKNPVCGVIIFIPANGTDMFSRVYLRRDVFFRAFFAPREKFFAPSKILRGPGFLRSGPFFRDWWGGPPQKNYRWCCARGFFSRFFARKRGFPPKTDHRLRCRRCFFFAFFRATPRGFPPK